MTQGVAQTVPPPARRGSHGLHSPQLSDIPAPPATPGTEGHPTHQPHVLNRQPHARTATCRVRCGGNVVPPRLTTAAVGLLRVGGPVQTWEKRFAQHPHPMPGGPAPHGLGGRASVNGRLLTVARRTFTVLARPRPTCEMCVSITPQCASGAALCCERGSPMASCGRVSG